LKITPGLRQILWQFSRPNGALLMGAELAAKLAPFSITTNDTITFSWNESALFAAFLP
jgi:hypothetical protein